MESESGSCLFNVKDVLSKRPESVFLAAAARLSVPAAVTRRCEITMDSSPSNFIRLQTLTSEIANSVPNVCATRQTTVSRNPWTTALRGRSLPVSRHRRFRRIGRQVSRRNFAATVASHVSLATWRDYFSTRKGPTLIFIRTSV
jgi:hypothetical protein